MNTNQNIQVFIRCRPMKPREKKNVVTMKKKEVKIVDNTKNLTFLYDQVFEPEARQQEVYSVVVEPLINQVLLGFNCTVFAYGQTGTGKTYTMEGNRSDEELSWEEDPDLGIIPRAISQLFDTLKDSSSEFTIRVSFLEIYNEDTYDLLSPIQDTKKLRIFEDVQRKGSVIVGGLEEIMVQSKAEIYEILKQGSAKRQTAETLLNACSSRSHTIFSITVHIKESNMDGEELLKIGKLNLVDLAGSENIGRSGAQDRRAREAGNINQSLLTLGRVITALVEKRPHIPYRESKLTRLLQDSLGGKTKTSIIATISPSAVDVEDTISTLEYASRAKKITNKPEMNERLTKKELLREYTIEIERLRKDLSSAREKNGIWIHEENYKDMCKQLESVRDQEDRLKVIESELEKAKRYHDECKAQIGKRLSQNVTNVRRELLKKDTEIIGVIEDRTSDVNLLHQKKERIENILKSNRASIDKFNSEWQDRVSRLKLTNDLNIDQRLAATKNFETDSEKHRVAMGIAIDQAKNRVRLNAQLECSRRIEKLLQNEKNHCDKLIREYTSKKNDIETELQQTSVQIKNLTDEITHLEDNNTTHGTDKVLELWESSNLEYIERNNQLIAESKMIDSELESLGRKFEWFSTREIKEDIITGATPQKKVYKIPTEVWTPILEQVWEGIDDHYEEDITAESEVNLTNG